MKKKLALIFIFVVCIIPIFGLEEHFYYGENYVFAHMEYITTDNLRLRKESEISSEIITTIKVGSPVVIIKEGKSDIIDNIKSNWVKISIQSDVVDKDGNSIKKGSEGWVFGGYLIPSANSQALFDIWISWGASERSRDELLTQFHLVCNTIAKEKSLSNLEVFLLNSEKNGIFPFNPLLSIIENDWKEGFDYIMTTKYANILADQGYASGKYDEYYITPLSTVLNFENSNSIYYAEKIIPMIDVNANGSFGLDYSPVKRNYLNVCKNEKIRQMLIENGINQTFKANNWKTKVVLINNYITLYETPFISENKENYSPLSDEDFQVEEVTYGTKAMWGKFDILGNNWMQMDGWAKVSDGKKTGWLAPTTWGLPFGFFEP